MGEIVWPPANVPWAGKGYGLLFPALQRGGSLASWFLCCPGDSPTPTHAHSQGLSLPPSRPEPVCFTALSLRACSCVNPRTVSRRFDLCTDQQLPLLPEPRSRAPVFLRVFHFLVIRALLGEPGNCTPTMRSGVWEEPLKPVLCRTLLRSDSYLIPGRDAI